MLQVPQPVLAILIRNLVFLREVWAFLLQFLYKNRTKQIFHYVGVFNGIKNTL